MLFKYKAIEAGGRAIEGSIDAVAEDVALSSLQQRGLVVTSIRSAKERSLFDTHLSFFEHVSTKDIVIMSRQIATLFEAQVSALRVFRLLSSEASNPALGNVLAEVSDDLQGGSSIAKALERHPDVFSGFYVNMVRSGEESGKLNEIFLYLADYLDRNYELTSKAKNALIYPAFVIFTFITVMILMLTMVIPRISGIIIESGQNVPTYTKVVIAMSDLLIHYGLFLVLALAAFVFFIFRFSRTERGALALDRLKISVPYLGDLYRKLYLSRIADNMDTMLGSGVAIIRAIEITGSVVDNHVYSVILKDTAERVKGGTALSQALSDHPEIPGIMIQMIKVGEESGEVGAILKTLARFYTREVKNAVDTLVGLIEPILIVLLGLGVGLLLASVLIPIYNISAGF